MAATWGKASKAWSLAWFWEIENGIGSGALVKWLSLWRPCLPKIYRGGPEMHMWFYGQLAQKILNCFYTSCMVYKVGFHFSFLAKVGAHNQNCILSPSIKSCSVLWHTTQLFNNFRAVEFQSKKFLSSPSACRTSGASKIRDWPHQNGPYFPLLWCNLASLRFLTKFLINCFDELFWRIIWRIFWRMFWRFFLTIFFDEFFYELYDKFFDTFFDL